MVKGYIDLVFEHSGRFYVCDWKGDRLPAWNPAALSRHNRAHYTVQAQLYTLAALRLFGVADPSSFRARFGGVVYVYLRGLRPGEPTSGITFERPSYDEVLAWQNQMFTDRYWGRT